MKIMVVKELQMVGFYKVTNIVMLNLSLKLITIRGTKTLAISGEKTIRVLCEKNK